MWEREGHEVGVAVRKTGYFDGQRRSRGRRGTTEEESLTRGTSLNVPTEKE